MIARFNIALHYPIFLQLGTSFEPAEIERDGYRIKVHPPHQSIYEGSYTDLATDVPLQQRVQGLEENVCIRVNELISLDGIAAYKANMLTVDFFKDDFVRPRILIEGSSIDNCEILFDHGDPPARLAFEIANDYLGRLRALLRSHVVKLVTRDENCWRLDYLNDKGERLPQDEAKFRRRFQGPVKGTFTGLTKEMWDRAKALPPGFNIYIWDSLLLDAEALLPQIGPAIVVANAALECFIPWALDELQKKSNIPIDLWDWLYCRKDWYQRHLLMNSSMYF